MTGGILVIVIIALCLAAAGFVGDDIARILGLYDRLSKPRARGLAAAARPVQHRRGAVPVIDARAELVALAGRPPRNGVRLPDRLRDTAPVVINGPVVPRWYEEWQQGKWTP